MRSLAVLFFGLLAGPALALDYASPASWLCRPDASGPCDTDLSLTEVTATGTIELPPPPARPPLIDCFYVYPTVSRQPAGNADGRMTDDEIYVVQQQFARYGEVCRRFAPLYRQTTLATISGQAKGDPELAYSDVRAAWRHYLANDNDGRGVLLIGHSQGARHLARLIAEEIADKPVSDRIVAAHVIGWPVAVADPEAGVAEVKVPPMLPLCRRTNDTGCTVAYTTFHGPQPPAADNRFAAPPGPGLMVACVNPARLMDTPMLAAIFPARPRSAGSSGFTTNLSPHPVTTASYQLSGLIRGECRRGAGGTSFLAAESNLPLITGQLTRMDAALPGWGLHLVDMNIALGNLVALARRQAEAWVARQSPRN